MRYNFTTISLKAADGHIKIVKSTLLLKLQMAMIITKNRCFCTRDSVTPNRYQRVLMLIVRVVH